MTKAINPTIQDFRNKGTFQSKDEIFARLQFNAEQHKELDDELFDFRKAQKDEPRERIENNQYQGLLDSTLGKARKTAQQKLKALQKNEFDFDFKNGLNNSMQISLIENEIAAERAKTKANEQAEKIAEAKELVMPIAAFFFRCSIAVLAGLFAWTAFSSMHMKDVVEQTAKDIAQTRVVQTAEHTDLEKTKTALDEVEKTISQVSPLQQPMTKKELNERLLDGVAKQAAMSKDDLPQATIDQVNRIGQMVLEQATKGEKK